MPSRETSNPPNDSSAAHPWVDGPTIGEVLQRVVAEHGSCDALVFPALGLRWSYAEFLQQVDAAARMLMAMGVERGQHVAVWATNVPQWVVLQFATARMGAVLVTINPAYRAFELKYVLHQCDAVALFLVEQFKTSDYFAMLRESAPALDSQPAGKLQLEEFPRLKWVVGLGDQTPPGGITWRQAIELARDVSQSRLEEQAGSLQCGDPINIQYTSGTTGFPKAAMLTHRNLLMNAWYIGDCQRIGPADRICIPVPFYHCFGCVLGTMCAVERGAAMIIPAEYFNPLATLDAIERERATAIYGVPTMFIAELQHETFPGRDLASLRTGIMAGSPCPIEVMRQVIDRMGAREITIAYGLTEASPVITQSRVDDPLELRVQSVGRPIDGVEVKLIDPQTGETLGDNQQGELCTRGHGVMLGYYKDPAATAQTIDADGWLHTGDLALRQPNGYYRITGRIKDMVIRGGENIYPREIEEFLFTHPAVESVSVVGVPDLKYGEELCAWIKLKPGVSSTNQDSTSQGASEKVAADNSTLEQNIRDYCRAKLAHYKVPRYIRFVDSFPQTVTGKIQKFKIREQMIEDLKLTQQETA